MTSTSSSELAFTYSQQGVPIFIGQDYELWSVPMCTLFVPHELWNIVEEGYNTYTPEKKAALTKDARALSFMYQGISRFILPRIFGVKTPKDACQILKNQFGGYEKVISIKLQNLWRDFDNLTIKDSKNMQEFFFKVCIVVNQIRGYGDTVKIRKIVEKHIAAAIKESKDLSKLSLDELMGSLETHEKKMSRFSSQNLELAFQGKVNILEEKNQRGIFSPRNFNQNLNLYCRICRRNVHDIKNYRNKCKRCKNANHSQGDCWYKLDRDTKEANFTKRNEANKVFYSA
ncbi:hypothetical protein Pfo_003276 [Paulownia fortunei]|nr:hypothetical protein Pfo_003276 [Paulownia fortunei]